MKTYWNTAFTKRDYECTNIVAVKAKALPKRFDPKIWKQNGYDAKSGIGGHAGIDFIGAEYSNGERVELYGYL